MKPIVISLLFAFDVKPVLTLRIVKFKFIQNEKIRIPKLWPCYYVEQLCNID